MRFVYSAGSLSQANGESWKRVEAELLYAAADRNRTFWGRDHMAMAWAGVAHDISVWYGSAMSKV